MHAAREGSANSRATQSFRSNCWDIGGAGAKADACAIWMVQFAGHEIRVLDYIEGQGQVLLLHQRAA